MAGVHHCGNYGKFARRLLAPVLIALAAGFAPSAMAAPKSYIVVLNPGVQDPGAVAKAHARRFDAETEFVYGAALKGYAATVPAADLAALKANGKVAYVERDRKVSALAQVLPWGIDRIDADRSSTLAGNGSGSVGGVNAYIIDSGIDTKHADLGVVRHVNFASGKNTDCNGHGTHVAGTVGARDNTINVVGAAPGVALTGVKVLGCSGSGSTSGVIAGVNWVTANAVRPAVANMSLGGGPSQALDNAVRSSAASGILYSIAAGNEGANACGSSPAAAGLADGVVTTAATDTSNKETSWSNYGLCVDLWAPGSSILSTRRGGGTTTMSGTSMAAPHVAGTAALYLSTHPSVSAGAVELALKADAALPGTSSKDGRPIQLLYAGRY